MKIVRLRGGPSPAGRGRQEGMSLVEVLVALVLLALTILGILPLFTSSMRSNQSGRDITASVHHAKNQAENLFSLPIDRQEYQLPAGALSAQSVESWVATGSPGLNEGKWVAVLSPTDSPVWTRTTVLRHYSIARYLPAYAALYGRVPLPGGTAETLVHVRENMVDVAGFRAVGVEFSTARSF